MLFYDRGKKFWETLDNCKCKAEGIFYTPAEIVQFMVKNSLDIIMRNSEFVEDREESMNDKFKQNKSINDIKICDIASGCGFFYFELIREMSELDDFDTKFDILTFVENNVFAIEKDRQTYKQLKDFSKQYFRELFFSDASLNGKESIQENEVQSNSSKEKNKSISFKNIFNDDALFSENRKLNKTKFDLIIGNPPYVGHKDIDSEYSRKLRDTYGEVYRNKSDLYYCFFKRALDMLNVGGICSMIVPRYFFEAHSAVHLREYLRNNTRIISLIDFRSSYAFSNDVGTSPCIITLEKVSKILSEEEYVDTDIMVLEDRKAIEDFLIRKEIKKNGSLVLDKTYWSIITDVEKKILDSINKKKSYKLGDICDSNQGIITGCDKAFIFEKKDEILDSIEKSNIKRWIKSKDIEKFRVSDSTKRLVYTDDMNIQNTGNGYIQHLEKYRDKLMSRREVEKGFRKWYMLQWGRQRSVFERTKIIYPYKSRDNRFALDSNNSYFSADVYSLTLKEEYTGKISYEYILALLNSKPYQTYMQSFMKKMGNGVVEYYPYSVNNTNIFVDDYYLEIEKLGKKIMEVNNEEDFGKLFEKLNDVIEKSLENSD